MIYHVPKQKKNPIFDSDCYYIKYNYCDGYMLLIHINCCLWKSTIAVVVCCTLCKLQK